ncbi:E3 ubiquitin-protein ligase RNF168-like [Cricetulus griseus]|uniref:E3 ubiquitin-protein ligase RNF168-like n=1 Tax=Cricetulus griseus TaxID=10029 RepID=UPI0015C30CD8|nr:E3 ubiquitin-protein ligase RNF168-like [Cricetulus griseus]
MPTLPLKICLETQEQGSESLAESPVPWLCARGAEQRLEGTLLINSDDEATVKPSGKIENEDASVSGVTQLAGSYTAPESSGHHLVVGKEISERENQDSVFEAGMDPCSSAKTSNVFPESSDQEEEEVSFIQKLIELEHMFFERHKQEEQDRLLALQLQKQMDKEQKMVNRQKGSPGQYDLRTYSEPDRQLHKQRKNSKDTTS